MAGTWIRVGTVSVTQGSKKITGSSTTWATVAANKPAKGHTFWGPDGAAYEVDYVESDTVLYLADTYQGATASGQAYRIDNTRDGTVPALSRKVSEFYAYQQGYIDALGLIVNGSGDVTFTAPDGQQITVPALSSMLSKSGNLAGVNDRAKACENIGALSRYGGESSGTIGAPQFNLNGSGSLIRTGNDVELLANYSALIAGTLSSAISGNARSLDGTWGKFDNSKPSVIIAADNDAIRIYKSDPGSENPLQHSSSLLTSDDVARGYWDPIIPNVSDFEAKNATYIRIGSLVVVRAYISLIGKTAPDNVGVIYGLPFLPKDYGTGSYTPCSIYVSGVIDPDMNAYIQGSQATISINSPVSRNQVPLVSGADYMFSAVYEIA